MTFNKLISAVLLAVSLSGCAGGLFSGHYMKTVATNPITGEALTSRYGRTLHNYVREARSVSIARNSYQNMPRQNQSIGAECGEPLSGEVIAQLGSNAAAEYFRSRADCLQMVMMGRVVAFATGAPTTAAGEVARETSKTVKYAEDGMTQRVVQPFNAIASIGKVGLVVGGYRSQARELGKVGVAAAKTGNTTTVGNILVSKSQSGSADSNDGGAGGSGGEAGVGGAGGNGSGSSSNSRSGIEQTIINIGGETNAGIATDDAMVQSGTIQSQQLEPSANGSIVDDSKLNGSDTVDEFNGDKDVSDDDGGNGLF